MLVINLSGYKFTATKRSIVVEGFFILVFWHSGFGWIKGVGVGLGVDSSITGADPNDVGVPRNFYFFIKVFWHSGFGVNLLHIVLTGLLHVKLAFFSHKATTRSVSVLLRTELTITDVGVSNAEINLDNFIDPYPGSAVS